MSLKEYNKLSKKHRKNLINLSKNTRPWEYGYALNLLIGWLNWAKDYYSYPENVKAYENYEWDNKAIKKSRYEMIEDILKEYDEWQNCENKYYRVKDISKKEAEELKLSGSIEYALGSIDLTNKAFNDEYTFHKHKFFELLEKYIEELWD